MILFYNKKNGEIFATIDGRVHDEKQLKCYVKHDKIKEEDTGKFVIGWIERKGKKMEYNMDKLKLLQKFEDISATNPMEYKIKNGKLLLKTKK